MLMITVSIKAAPQQFKEVSMTEEKQKRKKRGWWSKQIRTLLGWCGFYIAKKPAKKTKQEVK
jgi:hypothetical protein